MKNIYSLPFIRIIFAFGVVLSSVFGIANTADTATAQVCVGNMAVNLIGASTGAPLDAVPTVSHLSCSGLNDGAISITIAGGNMGYVFHWQDGATTQNRTALAPGTYTVTVSDVAGCMKTAQAIVTQPTIPTASIATTTNQLTCTTTSANLTASGNGNYAWNGGLGTNAMASTTAPGTYIVTVTNASSGCTATASVIISQNIVTPTVSLIPVPVMCSGGSDGGVSTNITAGTSPYTYSWNTGATTQSLANLTAAPYTVTVTGGNGCTAIQTTSVTQPIALGITITATPPNCMQPNGATTGSLATSVTGGTANYTYHWSDNSTAASVMGIAGSGTYTITVTDAHNCTTTASKFIAIDTCVVIQTGCAPATAMNVSGSSWINFNINNRLVVSINPNGNILGNVTVEVNDMGDGPSNVPVFGDHFLPRYFHITSDVNNGPFTNPVGVKFYYQNMELTDFNTASGTSLSRSDLWVIHYNGPNENCVMTDDDPAGIVLYSPTIVNDGSFGSNAFWLEVNVNHFSEFGSRGTNTPLPVGLVYFKGHTSGTDNVLEWETASEKNSALFVVERSLDGTSFGQIGVVKAAGNSKKPLFYNFTDKDAPVQAYYRLRMVDLDGQYEFSNVVNLERTTGKISIANVYPVPTSNNVYVEYEMEAAGSVSFGLTDAAGRQLSNFTTTALKGMNRQMIEMTDLPRGVYFVQMSTAGSRRIYRKVIKE